LLARQALFWVSLNYPQLQACELRIVLRGRDGNEVATIPLDEEPGPQLPPVAVPPVEISLPPPVPPPPPPSAPPAPPADTPKVPPALPFIPTPFQKGILAALDGTALRTDALGRAVGSRRKLFIDPGGIKELQQHDLVRHHGRLGYYRPDKPPPAVQIPVSQPIAVQVDASHRWGKRCGRDILQALARAGHRLSLRELQAALVQAGAEWSESSLKRYLAELREDGIVDNDQKDDRPGYGLAARTS
jgi:hypothetical protein